MAIVLRTVEQLIHAQASYSNREFDMSIGRFKLKLDAVSTQASSCGQWFEQLYSLAAFAVDAR
eukprot:1682441-Amphidinium_carterae.1